MKSKSRRFKTILVTGGAGYVGSILVPELLKRSYEVKVLDLYLYGEDVLDSVKHDPNLKQIKGDIRDAGLLKEQMGHVDVVIHLACVSNDPSFELDPILGKSINYDAFLNIVDAARASGVKRFIYASSSSVYGIKKEERVTEELKLEPLTDYSRYKALCEDVLLERTASDFVTLVLRPATVCGYSPRQRLDLTVNMFTNLAVNKGEITVFGGGQKRPNIHIKDMVDAYLSTIEAEDHLISGNIFNVGSENYTLKEIAGMVKDVVGTGVGIKFTPSNDVRSYHISSDKIARELGFYPSHSVREAVRDMAAAFRDGRISGSPEDMRYYNVKTMLSRRLR